MTTTPNMGLILPVEGGSFDTWGVILDALFVLVDAHDHTTGKGVPVPTAGININADLSFASAYGITNAKVVDFAAVAAASVSSYAGAFFVNSSDANNLYFRTVAGSNVKVTDGATLNVAAFTGGIGGDYSTAGALVAYVAANKNYTFKGPDPGGGRRWEGLATGQIDIFEQYTTVANRVRLQSPAALAASYALTLGAALPAEAGIVQVSTAGILSYSIILPRAPGFTAEEEFVFPSALWNVTLPVGGQTPPRSRSIITFGAGDTDEIFCGVTLPVGCRIKSWSVRVSKTTSAATTITAAFFKEVPGTETQIGLSQTSAANAPGAISLGATGLTETVTTGTSYYASFSSTAVGAGDYVLDLVIKADRPT